MTVKSVFGNPDYFKWKGIVPFIVNVRDSAHQVYDSKLFLREAMKVRELLDGPDGSFNYGSTFAVVFATGYYWPKGE